MAGCLFRRPLADSVSPHQMPLQLTFLLSANCLVTSSGSDPSQPCHSARCVSMKGRSRTTRPWGLRPWLDGTGSATQHGEVRRCGLDADRILRATPLRPECQLTICLRDRLSHRDAGAHAVVGEQFRGHGLAHCPWPAQRARSTVSFMPISGLALLGADEVATLAPKPGAPRSPAWIRVHRVRSTIPVRMLMGCATPRL